MIFQSTIGSYDSPSLESIQKQSLLYFFSNVFSLSLLSDMGIKANLTEEIYEKLHVLLPSEKESTEVNPAVSIDLEYKLFPLRAVYTQGNPGFSDLSGSIDIEKKDYHWEKNGMKKNINPSAQALLIDSEVRLAKYLYHQSLLDGKESSTVEEKYIGLLFLHSALEQGEFCHQYLRNSHGFFVEKKDKSKYIDHILLKIKDTSVNWLDQIYMLHAYGCLFDILHNQAVFPRYYDLEQALYFKELASQILHVVLHQEESLYDLKTRDLTTAIPLLVHSAQSLNAQQAMSALVVKLCAELCARDLGNGKLSRERQGLKTSSLATHGRAIHALTEGYSFTQYDLFYDGAKKIYHYINSRWDNGINLFGHSKRKKLKYSAMDIASILNGLQSLLSIEKQPDNILSLQKQLCSFFHSSINISGIQIAPSIISEISNMRGIGTINPLNSDLLIHENNSCVFVKEFSIYPKKDRIYLHTNNYESQLALYAALSLSSLVPYAESNSIIEA